MYTLDTQISCMLTFLFFHNITLEWKLAGERNLQQQLLPEGTDVKAFQPYPDSINKLAQTNK